MEVLAITLMLGAALVALALPLFRPPLLALRSASGPAARLQALELRKAAIYGAIREAGFDLRTDKVDQGDYEQQIALLKREAIEVVGEIEELKAHPPRGSKKVERAIAAARNFEGETREKVSSAETASPGQFCTQCGRPATTDDRFCAKCGNSLEESA